MESMTDFNHLWLPVSANLTLLPNDVHIWRINLDVSPAEQENLLATLSSDEVARANRFHFQEHRQRFIAGRGILRRILARYLGIEPQQVVFSYQERGKPILGNALAQSGLCFNLSHSQGLALCAVNHHSEIGVDLEYIRSMSDVEALTKRFFLPREYAVMRSLSQEQQQEIFFRYWTCKEAYLKATGEGLAQLEQIEILLNPNEPAQLQTSKNWSLFELTPGKNYCAAVVVASNHCDLKCWQY
ncbi:4'-phosphopantetheinyl transferase superfamily protein [Chrysosporum ovalisporum Ak1311]|jgi:4'-phosphopantetheinyl transferase|nr:4'-phosphopantetheinyl transferase HetI [Umezakia ovalisporum]MBI1242426.1 4'-phosphopantetheinyl transferase superfamily protein [Nostoc sp. RI_552]MDH6068699.1 4'-phosphopantetheinyl transferase superfamily protein [Umezakia ovalisporum APH033B]MDH6076350.1 4'-phosphopantetheinyl transferase superfamily protein [Umezakia ovalisporum FSS-45]MDH6087213.1 4'-phosphopantetheinyl transferase superfamily protein [Umezakia ovalisporum Ak1311]CEJ45530.1 4'-phosphopantetheinyl transferase [Umezaki